MADLETATGTLLRLVAFTTDPAGGNPAGVWLGDALPDAAEMQRIAAEVGFSETAFLAPDGTGEAGRLRVRYFSPAKEIDFCGHATIAAGVALAERGWPAALALQTIDGVVELDVSRAGDGRFQATLTSIEPWVRDVPDDLLERLLALLDWRPEELDPTLPPMLAFAGVRHPIIAVRELSTLARVDYDFDAMRALMLEHDLTTVQLIWRETPTRFRARDPFAAGGVVEDPATGAAAAALGAYLRSRGEIVAPATFEIAQGVEMGRPSRLVVSIVEGDPRVRVSGTAVPLDATP
ncbi:MAG TPA: PhzF family phenazine biosynthesis isomerase [Candidatus Limnocylindrales bacterium]|nr:PhzF family phenazine biosynthesis isomerase [Candidatus Limnocylindrales bacterium]